MITVCSLSKLNLIIISSHTDNITYCVTYAGIELSPISFQYLFFPSQIFVFPYSQQTLLQSGLAWDPEGVSSSCIAERKIRGTILL
jgi:hypothetical protein